MSYGTVQAEKMTTESGYSLGAGNASSFKNRVINGACVFDQRNAGASVTPTNQQYTLDRWLSIVGVASKFTVQQNAGSVTPPAGFTNYLGVTSTSAYSVAAGDVFGQETRIEGYNTADLAWGTANAKSITVSFWVYSSLTGSFGGVIRNNANTRSYPFLYTVNSANTWTLISVTVPGDTSGTWLTNNLSGVKITFNLGSGSTYSGTAGAWASAEYYSATGAVSVVGTNGATFYITGVQLEVGTVATSFDFRSIGTELALCQRYFEVARPIYFIMSKYDSTRSYGLVTTFKVQKRSAPSFVYTGTNIAAHGSGQGNYTNTTLTTDELNVYSHTGYIGLGAYGSYFCGLDTNTVFQYSSEL